MPKTDDLPATPDVPNPGPPFDLCGEGHPPGLSDAARKSRDRILDAAEAIVAGEGIDKLSLGRIEQRLGGMSRGQLTYYFPTREAILLAVFERMLRRMIARDLAGDGPKPMTGRAWECLAEGLGRALSPDGPKPGEEDLFSLLYTFLAQMNHRPDYRDRLAHLYRGWRGLIAADIDGSVPGPHPVPPAVAASLVQALFHGLGMQLAVDPNAFDRGQMLAACLRLMAPLFRPDQRKTEELTTESQRTPSGQ
ncbi:MAG: TetR family transcriptional regulator C-terminal domain-containing protein [Gemmataceae bacterium]|nr:TetR family transcriptional regulator C-terminal domain-containing protein [Gemmataceae bacterium]